MGNLIQLICDYGPNDMAWAEVTAAFMGALPDGWHLHCTTVPPFDTIATGFIVSQLCVAEPPLRPKNLFVFANTAPRKDNLKARENNEGEGLLYGRLKNKVQLVAVNSGFSMSFVKSILLPPPKIKISLFALNTSFNSSIEETETNCLALASIPKVL